MIGDLWYALVSRLRVWLRKRAAKKKDPFVY